VHFVFGGRGVAAYFEGADISILVRLNSQYLSGNKSGTYCIASISENWSARFRSCCKKVFRGFFFFLGCALVVAHRIVWYGMVAIRDASGLVAAIENVVSLLNGAISDRGCAIATMPM
jgi:hypothetical protein